MSDTNKRSVASTGSVDEPAAWGVLRVGGRFGYASVDREDAVEMQAMLERMENWKYDVVPLYANYPREVRLPKLLEKMHGETEYGKGYNTAIRMCQEIFGTAGVALEDAAVQLAGLVRLTDAEREAVAYCAAVIDDPYYKDDAKMAATLRGLLERLK